MKSPSKTLGARAFTLVEMLITIAVTTIVGGLIFTILGSGMVLYAKNTAVNSAHQQARTGVDQMLANIHSSVSIPLLVDKTLQVVPITQLVVPAPGATPEPIKAAGISFQRFDGGPFPVVQNAAASSKAIVIKAGSYTPKDAMRFNIPAYNIEQDIDQIAIRGKPKYGDWTLTFPAPIGSDISISGGRNVAGFTTYLVSYAVVGTTQSNGKFLGELRYYPESNPTKYSVVSRNITSEKPFSIPFLRNGVQEGDTQDGGDEPLRPNAGLQNTFVAAVQLSSVEPKFTQRGYAAVDMFISSMIPFRSRLTNRQ